MAMLWTCAAKGQPGLVVTRLRSRQRNSVLISASSRLPEIGCPSLEIPGSSPTAVARMGWGDDAHETLCINKKGRKTCRRELPIFT
jgi:hypothetical protein